VSLPPRWRRILDELVASATSVEGTFFRSVEITYAVPNDVVSGEGTRLNGGRFAPAGTRAVFASLDEGTAVREAAGRRRRLTGTPSIDFKVYPRLTYLIKADMTKCVDLRSTARSPDSDKILKVALDLDDQEASQEIGEYLLAKGVDGIIFPSVLGGGTNLVVFKDADPAPFVDILNRDEVLKSLREFAQRIGCGTRPAGIVPEVNHQVALADVVGQLV
jgi:RES domain-containing protein